MYGYKNSLHNKKLDYSAKCHTPIHVLLSCEKHKISFFFLVWFPMENVNHGWSHSPWRCHYFNNMVFTLQIHHFHSRCQLKTSSNLSITDIH